MREANARTLHEILEFVDSTATSQAHQKVPTALITTGAGSISHDGLFELLDEALATQSKHIFIPLQAVEASNLKTLLKNVIQKGTRQQHDDELDGDDAPSVTKTKGPRLLNYDLEILRQHCDAQGGMKVTLAIQDSEAFDTTVLTDLFLLLQ